MKINFDQKDLAMSDKVTSTIKVINKDESWGYIRKVDENHSRDYALYPSSLGKSNHLAYEDLDEDMIVSFKLQETNGFFKAYDVMVINDEIQSSLRTQTVEQPIASQNFTAPLDSSTSTSKNTNSSLTDYLTGKTSIDDSDLVIGVVSAVGTDSSLVTEPLVHRLLKFGYTAEKIKLSSLINLENHIDFENEEERINSYIKAGDELRKNNNNAILAAGAVTLIEKARDKNKKMAFIIDSLKHPEEVEFLRKVYSDGFYLLGIYADEERRLEYLKDRRGCVVEGSAQRLIDIDESEGFRHGQRTRDTYHLSDFYVYLGSNQDLINNTLQRFLDLIFSSPYLTPTFDEYAMFMAFNSSVRSGDLSRQVGAVVAKNKQIIATGANDVPKAGGGLYWSEIVSKTGKVDDAPEGKDYTRGIDSNKKTQLDMVQDIINKIEVKFEQLQSINNYEKELKKILIESTIGDLTEFGRVVHAEMEAILSCSREGISTKSASLYCTTFPCHNCAKHIIASGVERVVYVEPYPKSKALEFYNDSITLKSIDNEHDYNKVNFEPFIGVGPRRFLDLFSMSLGVGDKLKRKDRETGKTLDWSHEKSSIRTPLVDGSYDKLEQAAIDIWNNRKLTS